MNNSKVLFCEIFKSQDLIDSIHGYHKLIIVTDSNVGSIYGQLLKDYLTTHGFNVNSITFLAGECYKNRTTKEYIEDELFKIKAGRDSLILAIGGGVVTDLAGFVAATYCRGIPVIYIPTSLLCMVDACLGGKTGLNTNYAKNIIGTFTQPLAVFIDTDLLNSLPQIEYVSAFAEIIKHALISDSNYFDLLKSQASILNGNNLITKSIHIENTILTNVIKRSIEIKTNIVLVDNCEKAGREILNFGHTIAHAIEAATSYTINHGYAVAWGMIAESYISWKMNILSADDFEKVLQILTDYNLLQYDHLQKVANNKEEILKSIAADKKNRAELIRIILLDKIGSVKITDGLYAHVIEKSAIEQAIDFITKLEVSNNVGCYSC